jgi:molybdate transport system regulatory protein
MPGISSHACIIATPDEAHSLDTVQLSRLEQSFRSWVSVSTRTDVQLSRKRILLIFLLIRYTGAKLNEVLTLNPFQDIDFTRQLVLLGKTDTDDSRSPREVRIPAVLAEELKSALHEPPFKNI